MNQNTPRQTAAQWHEEQFSALSAYSSTVLPELADKVKARLSTSAEKDHAELARLYATIAPVPAVSELEGKRFWHRHVTDSRGMPVKCHANGKLKTWKTRPHDFSLPVKYGIRQCFYITPSNVSEWVVAPPEITHIIKYRTYWRYMGFCRKIANWEWLEENAICNKALDMQDWAIIMEELVIGLSGGFVNE